MEPGRRGEYQQHLTICQGLSRLHFLLSCNVGKPRILLVQMNCPSSKHHDQNMLIPQFKLTEGFIFLKPHSLDVYYLFYCRELPACQAKCTCPWKGSQDGCHIHPMLHSGNFHNSILMAPLWCTLLLTQFGSRSSERKPAGSVHL